MPLSKATILLVPLTAASLALAGCMKPAVHPPEVGLGQDPPAALVIVTSRPTTDLPAIRSLVTEVACPREHLEVVAPNFNAGRLLTASQAPGTPVMRGPVPPAGLPAGPTPFQRRAHARQLALYLARRDADQRLLREEFARSFRTWAASAVARIAAGAAQAGTGLRLRAGLSDGVAYFASLTQSGVRLGPHKVIVVLTTGTIPGRVPPIRPGSLHGATVVIANFRASQIRRAAWRDDLTRAGAASAPILSPAAIRQLPVLVRHTLGGCP